MIGCSLGPASSQVEDIIKLLDAGMSLARFNVSHGSNKDLNRLMKKWVEAKRLRPHKLCATMLDLRGREIRTGQVEGNVLKL